MYIDDKAILAVIIVIVLFLYVVLNDVNIKTVNCIHKIGEKIEN